jgi:hypothetical protein
VGGNSGLAVVKEGADHLQELVLVNGATPQFEVHLHVVRDRGRCV